MLKKLAWLIVAMLMLSIPSAAKAAGVTHTVSASDSLGLSGIKLRYCGDNAYTSIIEDNVAKYPALRTHPDLIYPGQELVVNCGEGKAVQVVNKTSPAPKAAIKSVTFSDAGSTRGLVYRPVVDAKQARREARRIVKALAEARRARMAEAIAAHWSGTPAEHVQIAIRTFDLESGLDPTQVGYNCHYWERNKWGIPRRVSKACKPQDRHKAWSVDCGLAQNNRPGRNCPADIMQVENNLAEARRKYDQRGFQPWVAYNKAMARTRNVRPRGLQARASTGLVEFSPRASAGQREFQPRAIIRSVSFSP